MDMEYRIPKKGEIYRHFKGNLYEIIIIARDSETLEEKVVYKEVNGNAVYVRSLPMFVGLVDKEKYPNVSQEFRFELVQSENVSEASSRCEECEPCEVCTANQEIIMEYLEKDTANDKIEYLLRVRDQIGENFLEVVAQSLEFVENPGSLQERFDAIISYLRTLARYEVGRLR